MGDASERAARMSPRVDQDRLKQLTNLSRGFTYAASLSEILRYAAEQAAAPPFGNGVQPHFSPWQLARSIDTGVGEPPHR